MIWFDRFRSKRFAVIALFSAVVSGAYFTSSHFSSNSQLWAVEEPSLKDTLEKGLKARLPTEFAFINRVVTLVDQGRLPRKLVLGTFDYARKKGHPKYPFPRFQRAMILRAAKIGVRLG